MYDYIIVGAGLYGSTFAQIKQEQGYKCLVVERRKHVAGNIYSEKKEGIDVHKYGPHIFHTDNTQVWEYINRFTAFNNFIYSPIANYKGKIYNLPFNMNTFTKVWDVTTPEEAKKKIEEQINELNIAQPKNLEEQALSLVGKDIYELLIKGYTEKQWGRSCSELPSFIIKRLPLRFTFDNNYFNHKYQGIPISGYTGMIEKMLDGIEVQLSSDFLLHKSEYINMADKILFTGPIDEFYNYCFGALEYRSLKFEEQLLDVENYQGVAGINYTDKETPYTRIIEHKHFMMGSCKSNKTIITKEYSKEWKKGDEPYYPINDTKNADLYKKYLKLALQENKIFFGGRLGLYEYLDMDKVIEKAIKASQNF